MIRSETKGKRYINIIKKIDEEAGANIVCNITTAVDTQKFRKQLCPCLPFFTERPEMLVGERKSFSFFFGLARYCTSNGLLYI